MNPYFEREWPDVHTRLIGYIADSLGPVLPPGLVARSEESIVGTWCQAFCAWTIAIAKLKIDDPPAIISPVERIQKRSAFAP